MDAVGRGVGWPADGVLGMPLTLVDDRLLGWIELTLARRVGRASRDTAWVEVP